MIGTIVTLYLVAGFTISIIIVMVTDEPSGFLFRMLFWPLEIVRSVFRSFKEWSTL